MIIVSATLDFESKEQRDRAIEITSDIQLATREEEEGCLSYCFAADPCVDRPRSPESARSSVLPAILPGQGRLPPLGSAAST